MPAASVTCTAFQEVTWQAWPPGSFTGELTVFRAALSDGARFMPLLRRVLSPGETERAARYHRPDDQLRFSATRGLLRLLLGLFVGRPPESLEFRAGLNQKPALRDAVGWYFNVSHGGNWLLMAIGKTPVGVDLEWVNPDFPFGDLLQSCFSPNEQHHINACADARLCFYQAWTRKEAVVKATAKGLDDDFCRIPSLPGAHAADAHWLGQDGHWIVGSFAVADQYPAAVAHNGAPSVTPNSTPST